MNPRLQDELRRARETERAAASAVPRPLPPPAGERRFQAALDADPAYRRAVAGAFALAALAGTGFGRIAVAAGAVHTLLWIATAAGVALSALGSRPAAAKPDEDAAPDSALAPLGVMLVVLTSAGWGISCWAGVAPAKRILGFFCIVAVLVALHLANRQRAAFTPVVLAAVFLHLAASPMHFGELHSPLWPQLVAASAEFALLALAGYRFALAGLLRLPLATYRETPLCIVPYPARKWHFPVKIDVA